MYVAQACEQEVTYATLTRAPVRPRYVGARWGGSIQVVGPVSLLLTRSGYTRQLTAAWLHWCCKPSRVVTAQVTHPGHLWQSQEGRPGSLSPRPVPEHGARSSLEEEIRVGGEGMVPDTPRAPPLREGLL